MVPGISVESVGWYLRVTLLGFCHHFPKAIDGLGFTGEAA